MDTKEICSCGHQKESHKYERFGCYVFVHADELCGCDSFRPAPSQPSMKVSDCCGRCKSTRKGTRIFCNECGEECTNLKSASKKEGKCNCRVEGMRCKWCEEKESTEVRDEKIARIVKEFRKEFEIDQFPDIILRDDIEKFITQTLTNY